MVTVNTIPLIKNIFVRPKNNHHLNLWYICKKYDIYYCTFKDIILTVTAVLEACEDIFISLPVLFINFRS